MVSSKCCQVESPSPLRFLAALMPPCAQTECERFTGTIENRSTCPPISAILMTAERPASPPPTTMILGLDSIKNGPNLLDAQGAPVLPTPRRIKSTIWLSYAVIDSATQPLLLSLSEPCASANPWPVSTQASARED